MLTKVGIVYSLAQCARQKLVISDIDDSHVDLHKSNMVSGEGWLDCPLSIYNTFKTPHDLEAWVATMIGQRFPSRCVVVAGDTGVIVRTHANADPVFNDDSDGILIQDDDGHSGWTYDFINAVAVDPNPPAIDTTAFAGQSQATGGA